MCGNVLHMCWFEMTLYEVCSIPSKTKEVYDAFSFFWPNSRRKKICNKNKSKTKLSSIAFAYSWCLECSWMSAFMRNASLKLLFNFLEYPISFPSSIGRFFCRSTLACTQYALDCFCLIWFEREREDTQHTNYKIQTCSAYVERNKCDAEWSVSVYFLNIFQKIPLQNRFFLNICIYTPHPRSMQKERKWKIQQQQKTIQRSEESHHQNELVAHNHEDAMNSLPCSIHQMDFFLLKFTTSEFILPIFICEES